MTALDLEHCDREQIHIPGSIQPHGVLFVLEEPSLRVLQVSRNVEEFFGPSAEAILGQALVEVLGPDAGVVAENVRTAALDRQPLYVGTLVHEFGGRRNAYESIAHRIDGVLVLELEQTTSEQAVAFHELYALVRSFMGRVQTVGDTRELSQIAAREVRRITGFDRVLVYRFDAQWNGQVIAEERTEAFPSLQDHWFPASDIPHPARELYRLNRWRLIADARYRPSPLVPAECPATGRALDLSFAGLRSVSPIHLQYLHNMGVTASMSISVLREGRLWGLISCHHAQPRTVPFAVRTACDFLGHVLSLQLAAREHTADYEHRIRLKTVQNRILASMSSANHYIAGLAQNADTLLGFAAAGGAAVVFEGDCMLIGQTPDEPAVQALVDWLLEHGREDVYYTDALPSEIPDGERYREQASGLLAISLSSLHRSYVLWFRPEVLQTIQWGGDPAKGPGRLHPRTSFETWRETVRGRSLPWLSSEVDAAGELRRSVVAIVLRNAEELAQLTAELTRSNQELEAFSYSVSHDLRAPFRHIVGFSELLRERLSESGDENVNRYLDTIIESAHFAGTLVDNLLGFAQISRTSLHFTAVDMGQLAGEVATEATAAEPDRRIEWRIGALPTVTADLALMRQVWHNLLANAVKYTRERPEAMIEVWSEPVNGDCMFAVRDNGVGFEMAYVDKLFGVFQRLHRMEEFEGTGIGLANVRRIVSRHGGRTWAEGEVGRGATFYFTLPSRTPESEEQ